MRSTLKKVVSIWLTAALLIPSGWLAAGSETEAASGVTEVYHETFTNGKGVASQSGGASLTPVTGKVFDGNDDGAALYVSTRTNNWDAADFIFADIGLENGKTYTATISVYVDDHEVVPDGAQAYLQTISSYAFLASANYEAGKAITLTKEFTVDTSKDTRLRVQSNDTGKTVPFYIGDVLITEEAADNGNEPPRPPALDFTTITFEDQTTSGFTGRSGNETLTVTDEANHTANGSYALKVEGRTSTWHGPSLRVEQYVDKGYEYKVSAWVKLIAPASTQLQLSTQVGNGSSANYVQLSPQTISTGDGWVLFEGTYRYNNVSSEYLTIYVESSNNSTASFYIDDISFKRTDSGPVSIEKDLVPIKDAYSSDFMIGNAISAEDLAGIRLELLKMHHNVVTAGNAMKPDALQPAKGSFTFTSSDEMVNKVLAEGMQMHGHVLVWHQQSPAWMNTTKDAQNNTIPLGREEALLNLRTHIQTVMEHFGDRVISWDVVNEAMSDNPPNPTNWQASLRQSPWYQAIGPDYVEQAFLAAREVLDAHPDWNIKLYYNDYNEDNQNKAQAIYSMVKEINDRYALTHPGKLLIDGVGMQGHYNVNTNPNNVKLSLEKFISLGVEISITELDIQAGSNYQLSEKLANAQGYLYAQLFDLFKAHTASIKRVTFWGLDDNTSWRASSNPLLFDKNLQAKPAYYGVIDPDKFMTEHAPDTSEANQATAQYATPVIDGTVDAVWNETAGIPINRYQMAWQGATGTAKALWDDDNLYLLIQVSDAQLDKSSANVWEQDSVEIFLDQNNAKTSFYQDDDGQYRINYDNEASFNPPTIASGFESATQVSGTNYTVEVKIPLTVVAPSNDTKLGFDVQINDAKDGARQSVAAWNDTTGNGYMDTSVYGVLTLIGKSDNPGGGDNEIEVVDGQVVIKPEVSSEGHHVTAAIPYELLKRALDRAAADPNGKKSVIIDLPKRASAQSYKAVLPTQSLQSQDNYVLLLKTEYATVEVPSHLLTNVSVAANQVSIRVAQASADLVNAAARKSIGKRPVIDVSVTAGDRNQALSSLNAPLTISIPYTPTAEELKHSDSLVVWSIMNKGRFTVIPNSRYEASTGAITFKTKHLQPFAVAYVVKAFNDIKNVSWAQQAIEAMTARDIIDGTSANKFSPDKSITRADFTVSLVQVLELQSIGNNNLKPNSNISHQDMILLVTRALEAAGKRVEEELWNDILESKGSLSRAEAAVILYRIWKLK